MFYREWYIDRGTPTYRWRVYTLRKAREDFDKFKEKRAKRKELKKEEREIERSLREERISGLKEMREEKREPALFDGIIKESRLTKLAIGFHDTVNFAIKSVYRQVKSVDYSVPREDALRNLDEFASNIRQRAFQKQMKKEIFGRHSDETAKSEIDEKIKEPSLEEKLSSLGEHYVPHGDLGNVDSSTLSSLAVKYDGKGIIPRQDEEIKAFVYRGNTILFLHKTFKRENIRPEIKFDTKNWDVSVEVKMWDTKVIKQEDIEEANSRIPYGMDLSWVAGFIGGDAGILSGAYGVCFTLPKYHGLNFLLMRESYKSREAFMKVLSHEMAHMGTVYLDTRRDFLETKAYAVGSAAFGEHTIALNQRPNILLKAMKFVMEHYLYIPFPDRVFNSIPKVLSAVRIAENRSLYGGVEKRLQALYGEDDGNYVLGRLTADEIEEFGYTNNVPARINEKRDLKWDIIRKRLGAG